MLLLNLVQKVLGQLENITTDEEFWSKLAA